MTTETIQQRQPRLTFACELDRGRLTELFSDSSIFEDLDYIVGRLEELGPSPQVQKTSSLRYDDEDFHGEQVHAGHLKNIIARIPGTDNTSEALLLVSHYDSMPTTPAAADGGVSTATLLETVLRNRSGSPPWPPPWVSWGKRPSRPRSR